jgi:microcystin-dependent protein
MTNVAILQTTADLSASQAVAGIAQLVPTGTVFTYAGSSAPTGWLLCDGSAVSRTTYAALFSLISTSYGSGDGSTTFNVPNTSGVFISGVGSQTISSISYSKTLAAIQGDTIQGHKTSGNLTANTMAGDGFIYHDWALAGALTRVIWQQVGTGTAADGIMHQTSLASTVSNPYNVSGSIITDGTNGTPRTGSETKPANIALNHIIKI